MEEIERTYNYYLKLFSVQENAYTKNDYFDITDDGKLQISFQDKCMLYDINVYKIFKKEKPSFFFKFNRDKELCRFSCKKEELFEKVETLLKKSIREQKLKELI